MATWQDGPEYAPLDPPDDFTVPDVAPLDVAEPEQQLPWAPDERPRFGNPEQPVTPLATLAAQEGEESRNPRTPFAVDSDTMTSVGSGNSGGAWSAAHWRPPSGAPVAAAPGPWAPPAGAPPALGNSIPGNSIPANSIPGPTGPMHLRAGPPPAPGGLPAPGTPAWFGPGPVVPQRAAVPPTLWRATPPGAIIAFALSIIWPIAPFTFLAGLLLSLRARYARTRIVTAGSVSAGAILLIATASTISNYGDFSDWWSTLRIWSLFGSLVLIVLILVLVNSELKNGPPRPPGPPR